MENGIYYMETEVKKQRRRIVTYEGRYNYSTAQAAIAGRSVAAHHWPSTAMPILWSLVHSLPFYQVALFDAEKCLVHLNSLNSFQAEISVTGENFFQPTEKLGVDRCWSVSPSLPS